MRLFNIYNKLVADKKTYLFLSFFFVQYLTAQIYTKPIDLKFDAILCSPKDTTRSYVMMSCTGENYKHHKTGRKIDDTWHLEWSIPQHTSIVDGEIEEIFQTGGGTVTENDDELFFKFAPSLLFERLEYCPLPMTRFPLAIGKSWEWTSDPVISAHTKQVKGEYGTEWRLVRDTTVLSCSYTVKREKNWYFKRENKFIDCFEIEANGTSEKGDTRMTAYFSPEYGFVFLDFETIDQRRYIFELKQRIFVPKDRYWGKY